jgi:CheY-like chemotaxis protein
LIRRTLGEDIEVVTVTADGLLDVMVDQNQLESALLNLAINARDAMPGGGRLTIKSAKAVLDGDAAAHAGVAPGEYIVVAVSDTGTGMPHDVLEHAFEPFYTTKEVGEGSGLGLSMVYGFAKQSGGHAEMSSEKGEGTTVRLYLPKAEDGDENDHAAAQRRDAVPKGQETVLVVEDEPQVRVFAAAALDTLGYNVLEAEDGRAALETIDTAADIELLFTDAVLPGGMNGRELAEEVKKRRPRIKVLFTSGYAENTIVHQGRLDEGVDLLAKPYTKEILAHRVRQALDAET